MQRRRIGRYSTATVWVRIQRCALREYWYHFQYYYYHYYSHQPRRVSKCLCVWAFVCLFVSLEQCSLFRVHHVFQAIGNNDVMLDVAFQHHLRIGCDQINAFGHSPVRRWPRGYDTSAVDATGDHKSDNAASRRTDILSDNTFPTATSLALI